MGVCARRADCRRLRELFWRDGRRAARRDFGETVDDMAQNFPYWFAGNFQKWAAALERDAGRRAHADRA